MWCLGINCSGHHFIKNMQSLLIILKGMPERIRCKNSHKISFNWEFIWFSVFVTENHRWWFKFCSSCILSDLNTKWSNRYTSAMWSDSIWPRLKLQQHYLHVLSFTKSLSHQDKIKNFDWTVIYSNPMRTNIYKDQTDIHSDHVYFISVLFLF